MHVFEGLPLLADLLLQLMHVFEGLVLLRLCFHKQLVVFVQLKWLHDRGERRSPVFLDHRHEILLEVVHMPVKYLFILLVLDSTSEMQFKPASSIHKESWLRSIMNLSNCCI